MVSLVTKSTLSSDYPFQRTHAQYYLSSGANPEIIGEASLLMGQTCFPNDKITGNNGHDAQDVVCSSCPLLQLLITDRRLISTPWLFTDIVFPDIVPSGDLSGPKIDLDALKTLGDKTAKQLASALKL